MRREATFQRTEFVLQRSHRNQKPARLNTAELKPCRILTNPDQQDVELKQTQFKIAQIEIMVILLSELHQSEEYWFFFSRLVSL